MRAGGSIAAFKGEMERHGGLLAVELEVRKHSNAEQRWLARAVEQNAAEAAAPLVQAWESV